jgi:Right handed beta helix region
MTPIRSGRAHPATGFLLRFLILAFALLAPSCARGAGGKLPGNLNPTGTDATPTLSITAGLTAIAAGDTTVRVDWQGPTSGFETLLYHSTNPKTVYGGAPLLETLAGDHVVLGGMANGTDHYFGLAIRPLPSPQDTDGATPVGIVLHARPNPVLFVDAGSPSASGDGKSPRTAFADLQSALASPPISTGRNFWIRHGRYEGADLSLAPGDHLFGGFEGSFGTTFELATRRPRGEGTIIQARPGLALFVTVGGKRDVVLDGLFLAGEPRNFVGIDADNAPIEIRSVVVHGFGGRGARLQNTSRNSSIDAHIAGCVFRSNGAEGLFGVGAYDLRIHGSRFEANQQEGLDFGSLIALEGETASVHITSCLFHGNQTDGMDIDMAAPASPGALSGRFSILIRGCTFSRNGFAGLVLDEDYELAPLWSARLELRECTARDNGGPGIHLDADGLASVLLHRCRVNANAGDGILITSEIQTGFVVLSASVFSGNLGAGARATVGQKAILATHCVFTGNLDGGLRSEVVESGATSCIARLQGNAWGTTRQNSIVTSTDPRADVFLHAPVLTRRITGHSGNVITLADATGIAVDDIIEIGDDGIPRRVIALSGTIVTLRPPPKSMRAPASLAGFAAGSGVEEDWRLTSGSPAIGAGMSVPGGTRIDAGVFGSPDSGAPGSVEPTVASLFWVNQTSPAWTAPIASGKNLVVAFSAPIDRGSVAGRVRAVTVSGTILKTGLLAIGDQIIVFPPPTGWGNEAFMLELHAGIRASDGTSVTTPLSIPLRTR